VGGWCQCGKGGTSVDCVDCRGAVSNPTSSIRHIKQCCKRAIRGSIGSPLRLPASGSLSFLMGFLQLAKWLISPSVVAGGGWVIRSWRKRQTEHRERIILDTLEGAQGRPVSVDMIHNEFLRPASRGLQPMRWIPRVRPGGDVFNEADLIYPKIPWRIRARYKWRLKVGGDLPTERKLQDMLRAMSTLGLVIFAGDDRWQLARS
jgi:hypothetical protein